MAHDYDIAVSLVLLNTFGFGPPGESWGSGTGTIPAQRIVADGPQHVRLRLSCFLSGCTNWQDIKLWVGHPDTMSPFPADPTGLFLSTEWLDNTPNGPFPDFLDGYVTQMNSGANPPTTSRGLQELEFVNEPEHLPLSNPSNQGAYCLKVMQKVVSANPHSAGLVLATAGPRSLAWLDRACTQPIQQCYVNAPANIEMLHSGFDDGTSTPPVARLDHWTMHGALPHVFHYTFDPDSPFYNSAQFDYARGNRVGVNTWSHFTSDALKADQPSILPCGFTLSPYEREAFNDNWRALTSSGALPNPSDPAAGSGTVNPGVVVVDQDLSDAVKVGLAQSTDGKAMLVVYADNYSAKVTHSIRTSNPETHAKANTLFARVRWENPAQPGIWLWFPPLGQPAVVLDASPGPLVFDDGRRAIASASQLDTTVVDSRYRNAMGYVNDADYDGVELVRNTPPFYTFPPYLRDDILDRRVKRRNADCDLAPSVVFQKQAGNLYRFFVAWSRPVPKAGSGINNSGENYFPDQDSEQAYFVPYKEHVVGDSTTYRKYEVLVQEVTVDGATAQGNAPIAQPLPAPKVMRTRGQDNIGESATNGTDMNSTAVPIGQAGASAMHPRLIVEPTKGHMVLVYMKSQDSWFDIADHAGGVSNLPAWEQASVWHVYPWEAWCKVYLERGSTAFDGQWVGTTPGSSEDGEWRVNDEYANGGLQGWLADHRYTAFHGSAGNPASPKGQFTPEYLPVVDPDGVAWVEPEVTDPIIEWLHFTVSFKALNTWVDPTFWHYPHGYETMAARFKLPVEVSAAIQGAPQKLGLSSRLRVAFRGTIPVDEESPVPCQYASHDAMYDMNEAPVIYTPAFGGLKSTVLAQNGQRVTLNCAAAQGTQESSIFNGLMTGSTRVFSSSMQGASVQRSNCDIVTVAWLYLQPPSQTGLGNPYVDLNVWGVAGGLTGQQTYRVVLANNEGADFQGRVLSVTPAGANVNGHQQFAVVWHQSGRIFRLVYTLDYIPGVFPTNPPQLVFPPFTGPGQDLASVTQVAKGASAMYGQTSSVNYLSSAKLKAAATRHAGLWAIKGWLNFKAW